MTVIDKVRAAGPTSGRSRRLGSRWQFGEKGTVLVAILVLSVIAAVTQDSFLTWNNLMNIVAANSVPLLLAIGSTYVIIAGGIDLSIVALSTTAGMMMGLLLELGAPTVVAVLAPLAAGTALGLINGLLISRAGISFLVVTLGMASIAASLALVANDGATINVFAIEQFTPVFTFATADVGAIPVLLLFDVVVILMAIGMLGHTRFGRDIFAIGSNAEAARLNGINVKNTTAVVYALAGLMAGVASIVQVGRLTGASPLIDASLLNGVLAAVLIGGTSFSGGKGSIAGTVLGVLFLGIVENVMTLADVSSFWRQAVNGALLIVAVWLGVVRVRRNAGRRRRSRAREAIDVRA